jgi:tetratricopeptide (TPR) repeat protein/transcriptional regulator with XRE-family HTH domain
MHFAWIDILDVVRLNVLGAYIMADGVEEFISLGPWVRYRRKALDLTQVALAERVGCAEVTIRKIEGDVVRPSRAVAERLVHCLELPPDDHAAFLQVARAERSVACLPSPRTGIRNPRGAACKPQAMTPLPIDTIPVPTALPPGSRMPLSRNPLFVGREADLRQLAHALTVDRIAAIGQIAATTGLGGIGKTQLACEFVHCYGQYFAGGVFWLSFADPAAVPAEMAACGGVGGMQLSPEFDQLPLNKQVRLVQAAWASPTPRLLVFDNCEEEALLQQWQPKHGGCCVLLTSRRHHWDVALGVQPHPLDVLARNESLMLLHQFRPDLSEDDPDLHLIAETLSDLPLALHLAGSFLAKYRHALTPAHYLDRLRAPTILDDRSLRESGLSPTQHVQHVARTFEQSYERLHPADPTDALARMLLAHAACFAPGEPLPRWLLIQTLELPDAERTLVAEDALMRLIDLGLLDTDAAGNLRLHRLVAAFVQAILSNEAAQAAVEATMLRVTDRLNEQRNPRPLLGIQPHLGFIAEAAHGRQDARAAGLSHALGFHLLELGCYAEAQDYLEQAVAIRQRVLGMDHPATAQSLNSLGVVLSSQGQQAAAQGYLEQALVIRQRVLAMDHPDIASSLNNLGVVFQSQGQYAEAQGYHEQAVAIRQRMLGMDHPSTAGGLNNLGTVLSDQGQYAEAQGYHEQALAIWQGVLGTDHPNTAYSLNGLGVVLWEQGQYTEAQHYHEQALAIWQGVLGTDHPLTAQSLSNLGLVLQSQGRYAEAQGYQEQALTIRQQVLGTDHPDTAWSIHILGWVLYDQGQYAEAQGYLEQALAIWQRVLGVDHPCIASSLTTLGSVLQAQGQYAEAQSYLEQAVALRQRVLGVDHPHTAWSLRALAALLHVQGAAAQARHYLEQAFAIFDQRLGPQHPDTQQTRRTLAALHALTPGSVG